MPVKPRYIAAQRRTPDARAARIARTFYEWTAEHVNKDGDVVNLDFADTYADVLRHSSVPEEGCTICVGVVRKRYDRDGDLAETAWAYVDDGALPEQFEDAYQRPVAKVPARFHRELAAAKGGAA